MNKEINEIAELCVKCKLCLKECEFLKGIFKHPEELVERFRIGDFKKEPQVPYSCNLCDLCESVCPSELNIGDIFLELRQQMVEEGLGPLPAHKRFVEKDQEWVLSDSFSLSLADPSANGCHRVFFPGCNLAGYSPSLVLKTYDYLRKKLPGTGIILGCCGAPTRELGEETEFQKIMKNIESEMKKLGAPELIVACPYCFYTFEKYGPWFQVKSLYEVMEEIGLPEVAKNHGCIFSLHDPCRTRWNEKMQDSVRVLISRMGYQIEEMKYSKELTRCCGAGGQMYFADFSLGKRITKRRGEEASHDILTYCASCRETLSREKPAIHVLDLIFNPNWENDRLKPSNNASTRRENQSLLKSQLEGR